MNVWKSSSHCVLSKSASKVENGSRRCRVVQRWTGGTKTGYISAPWMIIAILHIEFLARVIDRDLSSLADEV
jgi:hypothetical protein